MTNVEHTTTPPQLVAVVAASKLEKSPLNARRTVRSDGIGELKASILSHGLMQNLVVTAARDGTYLVIAGGRRMEAIHSLQSEGKLPPDFVVPCQVVTEEYAMEMSLAENIVRLAMHPADQFQAFAQLIDQGATADEVAERFGVDASLVHKRMKLARVAPELLEVYRDEGMTLECLMAFTITDDHRRQRKVFKSLQDWQKDDPSVIRAALAEKMVDANSKLALFVGVEAYTAAGGTSRSDLFSEEVYLEKPTLLNSLAAKKFDGIREVLEAEGWGWLEINPERDWNLINRCTRIQPRLTDAPSELLNFKTQLDTEQAEIERVLQDTESDELIDRRQAVELQLDQLEEQLVAFLDFPDEQKPLAGCCVSIGQDGTPFIDKGLVRPEQRKRLARILRTDKGGCDSAEAKIKDSLPESLRRDLAADRLLVAQIEIARHPQVALDLLIYQAAVSMLGEEPFTGDGADVSFKRSKPSREVKTSIASDALAAIADSLSTGWIGEQSEADRFQAFRSLPETAKLELLGYCVALTLKPKLAPSGGEDTTAYDVALSLTAAQMADYWRPTKDNLLARLTREQLLSMGRDVLGEGWSQSHANDKKSLLVDQFDRAFASPEKSGRTTGQVEKLKRWLPQGMSFDIAVPKRAKSPKSRNAA